MGEYYNTKESAEEYIKAAEGFNGKGLIEKLEKVLPRGSALLELGSGPGSDWEILNKLYSVTGSDFSSEFLKHLIKSNPDGEFIELDATTLLTDKKFDGIYSNKVLHHLTDEQLDESITRQHEVLNPNGIICHSFWRGTGSEVFKGLFVNYQEEEDLREFYFEHFEILSIEKYQEFEEDDSLLLLGRKK